MPKLLVLLLLSVCYFLLSSPLAKRVIAQTMLSPNYQIRMGNFNITSGFKSSASYNLTDTVGQTAAEFFSSSGYHVKAGFQYIYTLYDFTFALSSLAVDLGTLTPNTFSTGSHTLTVSAPGQGYLVTTYAVAPLTRLGGSDVIPDTTCDSGPCTETTATAWITPTNNGFGYNASGHDVTSDFIDSTYFRPFPDFSLNETPAPLMSSTVAGRNRLATITYQVSPSSIQAGGNYATQIVYLATPVY